MKYIVENAERNANQIAGVEPYDPNMKDDYVGDYIEAEGEITKVGNTSRKMKFEARKVIVSRPDINDSAADVLPEPIVVCRATGTCVTPKDKQNVPRK